MEGVFKMKLKILLPEVMQRLESVKLHSNVVEYREKLKASGNYNDFEVRFAWEVCHEVFSTKEICKWYDEYNCNDDHITSLFKAGCKKTGLL